MKDKSNVWDNRWSFMPLFLCLGPLPVGTIMLLFNKQVSIVFSIPFNLIIMWLILELLWTTFVVVRVENDTIIVQLPWRRYSLFARRKNQRIIILSENWDTLFFRHFKSSTGFYFRKNNTIQYFFRVDGFSRLGEKLQQHFPDKSFQEYPKAFPDNVIRRLRKKYPERVL